MIGISSVLNMMMMIGIRIMVRKKGVEEFEKIIRR